MRSTLSFALVCCAAFVVAEHHETIDDIIASAAQPGMDAELLMTDDVVQVEMDMLYKREDYDAMIKEKQSNRQKRGAPLRNTYRRWTNNVVPYSISLGIFSSSDVSQINAAIADWEKCTCLKFRTKSSADRNYVEISQRAGCSSFVGMIGGKQRLSLDRGCRVKSVIAHEIGHAIGFDHAQCRSDRDSYVNVNINNVIDSYRFAFDKYSTNHVNTFGVPYAYTSVMHYGPTAFSKNGGITMGTVDSRYQNVIGRASTVSFRDIKAAVIMYGCNKHCSAKSCPGEGFVGKDCVCYCPGSPLKPCDGSGPGPTIPPPTSGPPGDCKDNADSCPEWAARGECSNNPRYMLTNCKKSCGVCPNCVNDNSNCDYWASIGECKANATYMRAFCRKACNEC